MPPKRQQKGKSTKGKEATSATQNGNSKRPKSAQEAELSASATAQEFPTDINYGRLYLQVVGTFVLWTASAFLLTGAYA